MNFLNQKIHPLGMGCWPIGGAMYTGDQSLGYTGSDDDQSIRTIHAALDHGITLFDTAPAYGAGHSERLLGKALKARPDAMVVTKIGIGIDEASRQLRFDDIGAERVQPAIEESLGRLQRGHIDLLLLHVNTLPPSEAAPLFEEMETARRLGKIRSYGWSTDFSKSAEVFAANKGFVAVEHAMNLFIPAPKIQRVAHEYGLCALIRSPLAMGVLSGKYNQAKKLREGDIRGSSNMLVDYFEGGRANPKFAARLEAVRELLTTDGRSLVQGALSWLWAKSEYNIPVPGARTSQQIEEIAKALEFGALPKNAMDQIEILIQRSPEEIEEREL